jgi:hypothetical protein
MKQIRRQQDCAGNNSGARDAEGPTEQNLQSKDIHGANSISGCARHHLGGLPTASDYLK